MESGTQHIPQVGTYRVADYIYPSHKTIVTIFRLLYTVVYEKLCTEVVPRIPYYIHLTQYLHYVHN